jgi:hypothetical protein
MNKNSTPIEVIEYLANYFETFNSLPTPVIECQSSGTAYTAFGTNLQKKVEKAGGIKELLTTFTGRGQVKKEKKAEGTEQVQTTITKRVRPSRSKAAIAAAQAEKIASETAEEVTA